MRRFFSTSHCEERGTVLLFALIIMTTVVIASAGLSALVLNALQQSRIVDNAVVAYYAAESAIEDALFAVRREDALDVEAEGTLGNSAAWSRTVASGERVVYATIAQDETFEVALYDATQPGSVGNIARVEIAWDDGASGAAMQAALVGWLPAWLEWDETALFETLRSSSATSPLVMSVEAGRLHRLRLRALNADATGVEVRAFADPAGSAPVDVPGRLRIDARGSFVDAQQRISVTLPQRVPGSGLLDFALFSQCSIIKGDDPITC